MQPRHSDTAEIRAALQGRIVDLCMKLLPGGHRHGRLWIAHNPDGSDGKKQPKFQVELSGKPGRWTDWRMCGSGCRAHKHDVIGLIAYCQGTDTAGAFRWARDFLGLRAMSREERERMRDEAARRREIDEKRAAEARRWRLGRAVKLFEGAAPMGRGTPAEAHARAYLAGRGCPIEEVRWLNAASFRFAAATEWWNGAKWRHLEDGRRRKEADGPRFPAIHSAMRQATGIITCCHVTFMDPVRPVKAPVEPPKLVFGEAGGAVIEVATGPGGTPFWAEDARPMPVILAEGIETALSLAVSIPEARVWACGSLPGFGGAPVHVPAVADVTVARDNNHGNARAQAQLAAALERLEEAGKPMTVMASHVGDDFNDLITGDDT